MKTYTLTCIVLLCSAASAQAPKWTSVDNWRVKLEPYMTTRQDGKVIERPTCGIVRFERQKTVPRTNRTPPQPTFAVVSFTEPDWPNVPPDAFKSAQQLAREQQSQATLEKRKAAEEQRLRAMKA